MNKKKVIKIIVGIGIVIAGGVYSLYFESYNNIVQNMCTTESERLEKNIKEYLKDFNADVNVTTKAKRSLKMDKADFESLIKIDVLGESYAFTNTTGIKGSPFDGYYGDMGQTFSLDNLGNSFALSQLYSELAEKKQQEEEKKREEEVQEQINKTKKFEQSLIGQAKLSVTNKMKNEDLTYDESNIHVYYQDTGEVEYPTGATITIDFAQGKKKYKAEVMIKVDTQQSTCDIVDCSITPM